MYSDVLHQYNLLSALKTLYHQIRSASGKQSRSGRSSIEEKQDSIVHCKNGLVNTFDY